MLTEKEPSVADRAASEGVPKALGTVGDERVVFIDNHIGRLGVSS
jgi:hypothetical protein